MGESAALALTVALALVVFLATAEAVVPAGDKMAVGVEIVCIIVRGLAGAVLA